MFAPWFTDPAATLGKPERLVAYAENQFAQTALRRIGQSSPRRGQGLLTYLCGPAGSGKTHLSQWALRRLLDQAPRSRFLRVSAVELAEALEAADELGIWPEVMSTLTGHAVVVCEDLQELPALGAVQDRLAPLWDQLLDDGRQLVITSRLLPSELSELSQRLSNRIRGGLMAGLRLPGQEGRAKLVSHFGALEGVKFEEGAATLAAERVTGSPRDIRNVIEPLARRMRRSQTRITAATLQQLWQPADDPRILSLDQIVTAVAIEFGLPSAELISRSRQQTLIVPRQVAMYLTRELTGQSLERIGNFYGRTHTTVAHGCHRLKEQLKTSPTLRQQVLALKRRLQRTPRTECG